MSAPKALTFAKQAWDALPDQAKTDLIMSLVDAVTGKPPRAVRLAALHRRKLVALARVNERFPA